MKIVQIDGFRGLVTAVFIGACLFAGFVLSPGYLAMILWNKYLVSSYMFPELNLLQGVLLWAIIAISYCILTKGGFAISLKNTPELSEDELDSIIRNAKISSQMRMINKSMSKSDIFEKINKNPYSKDIKSTQENNSDNDEKLSGLK